MGESSIDRRLARLQAPKRKAAKPLTEEQKAKNRAYWHETYKLRLVKLPAFNQPLPECPREAALFAGLQRDAVVWRERVMPEMPCDPARYFREGEA
jgi:hypothetical protein